MNLNGDNIEVFGRQLLDTRDLDPVYVMLVEAKLPPETLKRWCLAYWCSYNSGFSSYASERAGSYFWDLMKEFAANVTEPPVPGRWPRGTERRHFRGASAITAVNVLATRSKFIGPEGLVDRVVSRAPYLSEMRREVLSWPQFGPWIAFKVADMVDRVLGVHVDFSEGDVFVFDSPREAAEMWSGKMGREAIKSSLDHLKKHLGGQLAPPFYDRPLNLQEYETILCKWKSHVNGHYTVGKDIHETLVALDTWSDHSEVARILHPALYKYYDDAE